jgi:hypothetical protein
MLITVHLFVSCQDLDIRQIFFRICLPILIFSNITLNEFLFMNTYKRTFPYTPQSLLHMSLKPNVKDFKQSSFHNLHLYVYA